VGTPSRAQEERPAYQTEPATGPKWLTVRWERVEHCLVVHLEGEIDYLSAGSLRELTVSAMEAAGRWQVVLDLAEVCVCDSSGLGALVAIWKAAHGHGGSLTLARVPRHCRTALSVTGLGKVFGCWSTIADALASLPRPESAAPASPSGTAAGWLTR
jgi:anti-anti-sigma factor